MQRSDEAENQSQPSDFNPQEYHATQREYGNSIPFYDAALLPILRENLNLYIEKVWTGAGLIAAETVEDMAVPFTDSRSI